MENQKLEEIKEDGVAKQPVSNLTKPTTFSQVVDEAKVSTVQQAAVEDKKFVEDFKKELKEATLKSAQLEKEKQELEKQNIELEQSYIRTKNELEEQKQKSNKWDNKEKERTYHYNGLKNIMEFIHITSPMNIYLMYILAILVAPVYLIWTLILCPLGTLICGSPESDRPKLVKGAIYTLLIVTLSIALIFGVYACMHYTFGWF